MSDTIIGAIIGASATIIVGIISAISCKVIVHKKKNHITVIQENKGNDNIMIGIQNNQVGKGKEDKGEKL